MTASLDLIQESLDEVTIKDTLEGDNMYTCSQCGKKVRAEKRCVRRWSDVSSYLWVGRVLVLSWWVDAKLAGSSQ